VPWREVVGFQVVPASGGGGCPACGRTPLYCVGSAAWVPAQAAAMIRALEYEHQAWLAGGRRAVDRPLSAESS
jgi:hypothetical protein